MKEESLTMFQMQMENVFRSVEEDLNQKIVEVSREHTKKVLKIFLSSVFQEGQSLFDLPPAPLRTSLHKKKRKKKPKPKRAKNNSTLQDEVVQVLQKKGKAMSVNEVSEAVLAKGYRTTSKNFRNCVSTLFAQNKKGSFRKTGAGTFTLKPSLRKRSN